MEYPISEILDRYSIAVLKKERLDANNEIELKDLLNVINEYKKINLNIIEEYIHKLIKINGEIWDLESDIRKGKEGELGLEEVGRRAIKIRELNKIRVGYKNIIVDIFKEGYKDIKMNHASSNE
jgi:hypothetical protein